MSIPRLFLSFKYALRGLRQALQTEQNFRVQILISLVAIVLAIYFSLPTGQIIVVTLLIGWVLTMELINTALEYISDLLKPRLHHHVYIIKDIMAAAVLISSVASGAIGLIIFLPYFLNLLK
ncbi:MAG: diacylglycerol kinase family protein [bacterium]|nr:diacylglycerol kinase family protein [bacterium]